MGKLDIQIIKFFPLQKIEITESTKSYKPGSSGYVCYASPSPGLVRPLNVIFIRYGTKGKPRATATTIFYQCLELSNIDEKYAKLLREEGGRPFYQATASLIPTVVESKNACEMPSDEFAGYVAAFSAYLGYLGVINRDPLDAFLHEIRREHGYIIRAIERLQDVDVSQLATVITTASKLGKVEGRNLFAEIVQFYDQQHQRERIMENLYKELSLRKQSVNMYNRHVDRSMLSSRENALNFLNNMEKDNKKAAGNQDNDNLVAKRARR